MIVLIWEYEVKAARHAEFENIYSPNGAWAELFKKQAGFIGTELLRDEKDHQRYLTIDRWSSREDFESFRAKWKGEYEALDAQCEGLTERESLLGNWETINLGAR